MRCERDYWRTKRWKSSRVDLFNSGGPVNHDWNPGKNGYTVGPGRIPRKSGKSYDYTLKIYREKEEETAK